MSIKSSDSTQLIYHLRPDATDSTKGTSSYETIEQVCTPLIKDTVYPLL